jgi:predicted permease
VALAVLGVRALRALGEDAIPRLAEVGFDPAVLGFAALVTLATGIAFGIAPAWRFAAVEPSAALREQSRAATGGRAQGRVRGGLAAAQVALALTLLAGAGVLMASFARLQRVELGFRADRVLTLDLTLPPARYDSLRRAGFQEELARRLGALPGATAAGATSRLPATGSFHNWGTRILTGPRGGEGDQSRTRAEQRVVSGRFFEALSIPLLAGRLFDERDGMGTPGRVVVSAAFAREAFPGMPLAQVVGQRISPIGEDRDIIGVVGDVALDARGAPGPAVYHAHRQFAGNRNWALTHVVATRIPPERLLPAVRAEVAAMDPELVVHRAAPLAEVVGRGVGRERFAMALMGAFAAVALVLAALGLYGVLAYSVRQRTREIGIRIALGATGGQVRGLVLRHAAVVVGVGLLGGALGAAALGRWLSSLVFQTSPWDPAVLGATAVLLTLVAFAAAWLPAWRASRVEPRIAMQAE